MPVPCGPHLALDDLRSLAGLMPQLTADRSVPFASRVTVPRKSAAAARRAGHSPTKTNSGTNASSPVLLQPVFNEGNITPDPSRFQVPHASDTAQYAAIQKLLATQVVSFKASTAKPDGLLSLEGVFGPHGPEIVQRIRNAKRIVFHAVGDTGASNSGVYSKEIHAADQMVADCRTSPQSDRPAFFYHLGDVVYSFGESSYYYDQFYEAYRDYPGPIFAIPGNHDSFVLPNTAPADEPLRTFQRNFCSSGFTITPEARSLHRTAMTQPGVYFTLDAPFVRILGLFSNALEDPGVISSDNGTWPGVPDHQLGFLQAQLRRIKTESYAGAVLLAVHHPPFSYHPKSTRGGTGGSHKGSAAMLAQIDGICKAEGVYPHAFLSGHAHNYQCYVRNVRFGGNDYEVPFVVCGDGGHHVNPLVKGKRGQPAQEPAMNADVSYLDPKLAVPTSGLTLKLYDDTNFGYLRIAVDKHQLKIAYHSVGEPGPQSQAHVLTVDLATHRLVVS